MSIHFHPNAAERLNDLPDWLGISKIAWMNEQAELAQADAERQQQVAERGAADAIRLKAVLDYLGIVPPSEISISSHAVILPPGIRIALRSYYDNKLDTSVAVGPFADDREELYLTAILPDEMQKEFSYLSEPAEQFTVYPKSPEKRNRAQVLTAETVLDLLAQQTRRFEQYAELKKTHQDSGSDDRSALDMTLRELLTAWHEE